MSQHIQGNFSAIVSNVASYAPTQQAATNFLSGAASTLNKAASIVKKHPVATGAMAFGAAAAVFNGTFTVGAGINAAKLNNQAKFSRDTVTAKITSLSKDIVDLQFSGAENALTHNEHSAALNNYIANIGNNVKNDQVTISFTPFEQSGIGGGGAQIGDDGIQKLKARQDGGLSGTAPTAGAGPTNSTQTTLGNVLGGAFDGQFRQTVLTETQTLGSKSAFTGELQSALAAAPSNIANQICGTASTLLAEGGQGASMSDGIGSAGAERGVQKKRAPQNSVSQSMSGANNDTGAATGATGMATGIAASAPDCASDVAGKIEPYMTVLSHVAAELAREGQSLSDIQSNAQKQQGNLDVMQQVKAKLPEPAANTVVIEQSGMQNAKQAVGGGGASDQSSGPKNSGPSTNWATAEAVKNGLLTLSSLGLAAGGALAMKLQGRNNRATVNGHGPANVQVHVQQHFTTHRQGDLQEQEMTGLPSYYDATQGSAVNNIGPGQVAHADTSESDQSLIDHLAAPAPMPRAHLRDSAV